MIKGGFQKGYKSQFSKPTFLLSEVMQILKNMGHDISCGSCMSIAFTGITTTNHTCKRRKATKHVNERKR